mmetsp:Transcript_3925/g.6945  ORF Transcript_3925/g.6945 Transcript_3925/m.6945 type:complete len:468 (+) Transcript_3925:473-1876(+)
MASHRSLQPTSPSSLPRRSSSSTRHPSAASSPARATAPAGPTMDPGISTRSSWPDRATGCAASSRAPSGPRHAAPSRSWVNGPPASRSNSRRRSEAKTRSPSRASRPPSARCRAAHAASCASSLWVTPASAPAANALTFAAMFATRTRSAGSEKPSGSTPATLNPGEFCSWMGRVSERQRAGSATSVSSPRRPARRARISSPSCRTRSQGSSTVFQLPRQRAVTAARSASGSARSGPCWAAWSRRSTIRSTAGCRLRSVAGSLLSGRPSQSSVRSGCSPGVSPPPTDSNQGALVRPATKQMCSPHWPIRAVTSSMVHHPLLHRALKSVYSSSGGAEDVVRRANFLFCASEPDLSVSSVFKAWSAGVASNRTAFSRFSGLGASSLEATTIPASTPSGPFSSVAAPSTFSVDLPLVWLASSSRLLLAALVGAPFSGSTEGSSFSAGFSFSSTFSKRGITRTWSDRNIAV